MLTGATPLIPHVTLGTFTFKFDAAGTRRVDAVGDLSETTTIPVCRGHSEDGRVVVGGWVETHPLKGWKVRVTFSFEWLWWVRLIRRSMVGSSTTGWTRSGGDLRDVDEGRKHWGVLVDVIDNDTDAHLVAMHTLARLFARFCVFL